jgi:hypothetical protein
VLSLEHFQADVFGLPEDPIDLSRRFDRRASPGNGKDVVLLRVSCGLGILGVFAP